MVRIALLLSILAAVPLAAATYDVGTGQPYPTIASLPGLVAGDLVQVHSGTYNEVKRWTDAGTASHPIVIRGVGPSRPVIDATGFTVDGSLPNPRAVFQIEASWVTVENFDFKGARNGDNGASVRVTGFGGAPAGVVVRGCRLHDCDMGIMNGPCESLLVENCEIDHNGTTAYYGFSHNTYFGGNATTMRGCYVHDALYGQNVKSRAHYTELLYNYIADSSDGEVELADAVDTDAANSNAVMIGNVIISKADRGPSFNNGRFVQFGQDSGIAHRGTLFVYNNTFIAGSGSINFLDVNQAQASLVASGNIFVGSAHIATSGVGSLSGTKNWMEAGAIIPAAMTASVTGASAGFVDQSGRDVHLTAAATARDLAPSGLTYIDGAGASHAGAPTLEYVDHLATAARSINGALDAGAYEYGSGSPLNAPPTVSLTSPLPGATFTAPATVTLAATATDSDGTIARVQFFSGTTLIATDTANPYSVTWTPVAAGTYVITAKATDNAAAITSSTSVTITVSAPVTTASPPAADPGRAAGAQRCGLGGAAAFLVLSFWSVRRRGTISG